VTSCDPAKALIRPTDHQAIALDRSMDVHRLAFQARIRARFRGVSMDRPALFRRGLLAALLLIGHASLHAADLLDNADLVEGPLALGAPTALALQVPHGQRADVLQQGQANLADLSQIGENQLASIVQQGSDQQAFILQQGENQLASIVQIGQGNLADISQIGSDNQAAIAQMGANNNASIEQLGSGLSSSVIQYGSGQHIQIVQHQ